MAFLTNSDIALPSAGAVRCLLASGPSSGGGWTPKGERPRGGAGLSNGGGPLKHGGAPLEGVP